MFEQEIIDKLKKKLASYRSVKSYTETALEEAIDALEDVIKVSKTGIVDLLKDRKQTLQQTLNFIQQDCE